MAHLARHGPPIHSVAREHSDAAAAKDIYPHAMDLTNRKEFLKLVADCRKYGIISVKSGDFELKLAPQALFPESDYKKKKASEITDASIPVENQYTDEEILMWSSAGIPETQEGAH